MLADWFNGISELIARAPGVTVRLNEPTPEAVIAHRIHLDFADNAGASVAPKRPFFVLQEGRFVFEKYNADDMDANGVVEVFFTDTARHRTNHKQSKLDFTGFVGDLIKSIADRQGREIDDQATRAYLSLYRIRLIQPPTRAPQTEIDVADATTDYWWCSFACYIGEVPD